MSAYVFLAPEIVAWVVTLGVMQQIIRAFGRVEGSMQYLLKAWPTIIELASVYKRLREFETQINEKEIVEEKISKLIIVTGKGLHSDNEKNPYVSKDLGILKHSIPEFVKNNLELMKIISDIKEANIEDGGSGAFYIYLKKN